MEEKLLEIAKMMNDFSKEYDCRIDIETYESQYIGERKKRIIYRLSAVKPEEILTEATY